MGSFPTLADVERMSSGVDSANSNWFTVTASASINTKGAWTQLVSSTPFACSGVIVGARTATASRVLLSDIGIGAAASEYVLIPNLHTKTGASGATWANVYLPVSINAGVRVAARTQSATASQTVQIGIILIGAT